MMVGDRLRAAMVGNPDIADLIGKAIPGFPGGAANAPIIISVVKDYHFQSLYRDIIPMMLTVDKDWHYDFVLVRTRYFAIWKRQKDGGSKMSIDAGLAN